LPQTGKEISVTPFDFRLAVVLQKLIVSLPHDCVLVFADQKDVSALSQFDRVAAFESQLFLASAFFEDRVGTRTIDLLCFWFIFSGFEMVNLGGQLFLSVEFFQNLQRFLTEADRFLPGEVGLHLANVLRLNQAIGMPSNFMRRGNQFDFG
jgi:hypothetical protein